MTNQAINKGFVITNLAYRLSEYYPGNKIQIGTGNPDAGIVVVQPHTKMPERDAVTGALKKFDILNEAYRATSRIIDFDNDEINRVYLKELIEIVKPLIVVACGQEVMSLLSQRNIRSFKSHTGKKFRVKDLTDITFYATLNPFDYGYARAPQTLKAQGKKEWTKLSKIYNKLKEKEERDRWSW